MSGKLDKSLDEILVNRRQGRGQRRRGNRTKAAAAPVPVGGVKKSTKGAKPAGKAAQNGHLVSKESKIMVSGLPADVNEANIKEYFTKSAGPVKRVMLTYNQNGTSRGIASITFTKPDTAAKAAKDLNGLLVDGKPMKIEVVVDASHAPAVPAAKPLGDRVAQGKSQPKPATTAKQTARSTRGRKRRAGGGAGRPKPKTAEELDAEMVDYFNTGNENGASGDANAAAGGAAQQPAGEDLGMAEIS